jgi:PAS domain S-box-containing protein
MILVPVAMDQNKAHSLLERQSNPITSLPGQPAIDDQLFRILVQGVTDYAIYLLDAEGRITTWNAGAERISGYTAEEVIGSHFSRFYTREDRVADLPKRALRTAAEAGRYENQGWRLRKNGTRFRANVVIDAIYGQDRQPIAFAKVTRDLTERLGTQSALLDSEERFRLLVQGVTDYAIYMLDPDGYITNWNIGGERIKGYSESEAIGKHFSVFYTEEDRARGEPNRTITTAAREGRFEGEGWRVRRDGSRFWASVVVDRILGRDGRLVGFAKITRDMTDKKRAEEELERARAALAQSQKMEAVGQLTGGVAHDFNNLLTVIANSLDLLSRPLRNQAQRQQIIDSAQRATERGAKLTQQLLAFSRRQSLRPDIHDLNKLIGEFEPVLRRACSAPIDFRLSLSETPVAANIDAPQFETALLNLVVNARDAMPDGGMVRIATGHETIDVARARTMADVAPGEYATVSIADNGEGMTPEVLARAFEPFFTTKEVGRGSGLGLSQVYGFVTQSGGHVDIDSRPDAGTTITLYLPARPAPDTERVAATANVGEQPSTGRVLVVEDDPEVLKVTVESLRTLGYEVLTATDGLSALAILRRDPDIEILLSDVVMPCGLNGVELAREAMRLRPQLRILLASGYPRAALSASGGAATGTEEFPFLAKPYRGSELADALRALRGGVKDDAGFAPESSTRRSPL